MSVRNPRRSFDPWVWVMGGSRQRHASTHATNVSHDGSPASGAIRRVGSRALAGRVTAHPARAKRPSGALEPLRDEALVRAAASEARAARLGETVELVERTRRYALVGKGIAGAVEARLRLGAAVALSDQAGAGGRPRVARLASVSVATRKVVRARARLAIANARPTFARAGRRPGLASVCRGGAPEARGTAGTARFPERRTPARVAVRSVVAVEASITPGGIARRCLAHRRVARATVRAAIARPSAARGRDEQDDDETGARDEHGDGHSVLASKGPGA